MCDCIRQKQCSSRVSTIKVKSFMLKIDLLMPLFMARIKEILCLESGLSKHTLLGCKVRYFAWTGSIFQSSP